MHFSGVQCIINGATPLESGMETKDVSMGAVWDLVGDILSATVYTGRNAAQVCLLGICLFVILRCEADRGGTRGGGHVLYRVAARRDVNLKSPRFHFLHNVGSFYCSPLFVFPPAALWLIESSEKAGDLDSIMLPTSTPAFCIPKSLPQPSFSLPLPDRLVIFLFPAEPLCVVALQEKRKERRWFDPSCVRIMSIVSFLSSSV